MEIKKKYSPNFDKKKRSKKSIKIIVIHYTGMQSERESLLRLCDPKSKVSSHFVINQNGIIYRLVDNAYVAWHAGRSSWKKCKGLNKNSIGIELINKGHEFGYTSFKNKQITSLIKVCKILIKKYKIKNENIVGHSDIAPLRKKDPGEKFPWKKLAKNNISIWHSCKINKIKKLRNIRIFSIQEKKIFIKNLKKIGYFLTNSNNFLLTKTIKAFQRHYRQELINGKLDKECIIIAENLSKKL